MDREFDSQHVLEMLSQRRLSYVVPKRMQTSEKTQAKRLLRRDQDRYEIDRKHHLGNNEWHQTTLIYRRNENSEHDDHRQYSVFMTNRGSGFLSEYGYRWEMFILTVIALLHSVTTDRTDVLNEGHVFSTADEPHQARIAL